MATNGKQQDTGIYIRCDSRQKKALESFIKERNKERKRRGQKAVALSTWIRELALRESGNECLGAAALLNAEAEAAKQIL